MGKLGVLMAGGIVLAIAGGGYLVRMQRSPSPVDSQVEPLPQRDGGLGAVEAMPADLQLLEAAGSRDFKNKYTSTVMVTTKRPLEVAECSGVVIGPRLVLTVGHCVCKPNTADGSLTAKLRRIDGAACAGQANAITLLYGTVRSAQIADLQARVYAGTIRPHPEMQLVFDDSGAIMSAQADLAVLVLNEPVESGIPSAVLADTEVTLGESLVMTGYGYDKNMGGIYGARYYRTNKIVSAQASFGGRFVYEQQGAYVYNGFDGGPCFRERGSDRWLVGISGVGTEKELPLTSTVFFSAWIKSELDRTHK